MENYRVIEIKQSVFADNDQDANRLRQELKENKTFLLNLCHPQAAARQQH